MTLAHAVTSEDYIENTSFSKLSNYKVVIFQAVTNKIHQYKKLNGDILTKILTKAKSWQ